MAFDDNEFRRHKCNPVLIKTIEAEGPDGTICGVLREIYHSTQNPEVRDLARLAMAMAKKMGAKLNEYKQKELASG